MLFRKQASAERDEHIDLTPMVDVVFQLMTFMLFSIQLTGSELSVPTSKNGVGVDADSATKIWLLRPATVDGPARAFVGEDGPEKSELSIDDIEKAIATGVAEGRRKIVLQADGEVPHGEVLRFASLVKKFENVTLHIGVQEPD
jgi:biopolymer transport protein ExbD